jgi:hypothetical protein
VYEKFIHTRITQKFDTHPIITTYKCEEIIKRWIIMPEFFQQASDIIILIAAVLGAIAAIWKFCINSGKGIKKTVADVREKEEREFNDKVDVRIKEKVQPMIDQSARTLTASFTGLLDKHLPDRLVEHDKETRKKYLSDRQKYLEDIRDEVILEMQERLNSVETHDL